MRSTAHDHFWLAARAPGAGLGDGKRAQRVEPAEQGEVGGGSFNTVLPRCDLTYLSVLGPLSSLLPCRDGAGLLSPSQGFSCPEVSWPKPGSPLCQEEEPGTQEPRAVTRDLGSPGL